MRAPRAWVPAVLALATALGGCGYSAGIRLPSETTTVGVEVFGNDSKLRDLEVELQAALVDSMNRLVHAPLVSPRRADLVLRGRVVDYSLRRGIRSGENVRLESGVRIALETQLVRRVPESPDAPAPLPEPEDPSRQRGRAEHQSSLPPLAAGERVERTFEVSQEFGFVLQEGQGELGARRRTLANLADRIVLDLFGSLTRPAER